MKDRIPVASAVASEIQHDICERKPYKYCPVIFIYKQILVKYTPSQRQTKLPETTPAQSTSLEIPKVKRLKED